MTEDEWLACVDPEPMLDFLRTRASERKLRLFAVECCRRFCDMLIPETLAALQVAERFADGLANDRERREARERAFHAGWSSDESLKHRRGPAKACVTQALARRAFEAATGAAHLARQIGLLSRTRWESSAIQMTEWGPRIVDWSSGQQEQKVIQVEMLHDLFDALFCPVPFETHWRTSAVVGIARTIYEDREFGQLPILADALVDAGCEDEEILQHCRNGKAHFRGCWAVDLVLGRG